MTSPLELELPLLDFHDDEVVALAEVWEDELPKEE